MTVNPLNACSIPDLFQQRARTGRCVLCLSTGVSILLALAVSLAADETPDLRIKGPLTVLKANPRYFTDGSGKAIYLTGSHTWDNFQRFFAGVIQPGGGGLARSPTSFTAYLDMLESHQHNFIRMWVAESAWSPHTLAPIEPQPYVRTGPGTAAGGGLKFDLNQLNQAYFDELRSRVIAARDRGMYVSLMLFDMWGIGESKNSPQNTTWNYHPFNTANNINGINGDPNGDGVGLENHSLQIPAITTLQEAYVRKVVDTVNDLDNVLYEIKNEGGGSSTEWQYHLINFIKTYEGGKPKRHPVGMTAQTLKGGSIANLLNSPADWISPGGDNVRQGPYFENPPAATGNKVIITDTDHIAPTTTDATWVWRSFLRGLNPIVMDWWNGDHWDSMRSAMGHTRRLAERVDLAAMTPREDLATTKYCLAQPGVAYIVYLPSGGEVTVDLSAASGNLQVEWIHPVKGTITSGQAVIGGTKKSFTSPYSGDAALYLSRPEQQQP